MQKPWYRVQSMRFHHVISSALIALALAACGSDDEAHMHDDPPDDEMVHAQAECPDTIPEMSIGMLAAGQMGNVQAKLIAADKIPLGWYHNDWVVEFTPMATGEPVEDLEFGVVRPFMPVHGHDGNGQFPTIEPADVGQFDSAGINISMAWPWETQSNLQSATSGDDYIVFDVCKSRPKPAMQQ